VQNFRNFVFATAILVISLLACAPALVASQGYRAPDTLSNTWYANAVFYQVQLRSFQDSNDDGIGDLKGLQSRLGDLQRLGVTALWLNPIYSSPDWHGYNVTDYKNINQEYGTLEDFKSFIDEAHARGMRVLLDFVANHTSKLHPWFIESKSPNSPKHNWYLWRNSDPNWRSPIGAGNPWHLEASNSKLKVIFPGTIQTALGGQAWNPNGLETQATEISNGVYALTVVLPAGRYEYKVTLNGSWDKNYGLNGIKNGLNIVIDVPKSQIVKFVFDCNTQKVWDSINNPKTVIAPSEVPTRVDAVTTNPAYYYGVFGEGSPDLNWRNPEVKTALFEAAKFWLERGADGFRVDAVRHLFEGSTGNSSDVEPDQPETLAWVSDFSSFVHRVKPDAAIVTEAWATTHTVAKYFVNGHGQQLGFDFDLQYAIRESIKTSQPKALQSVLEQVAQHYPPSAVDAIFTSNHDLERLNFSSLKQYRSAAVLLMTLPGTPFIYYGEEIGLPNNLNAQDDAKHAPMKWDSTVQAGFSSVQPWSPFSSRDPKISVGAQVNDPDSTYSLYRDLILVRKEHGALRTGGYIPLKSTNEHIFSFLRWSGTERIVVVLNLSSDRVKTQINLGDLNSVGIKTLVPEKNPATITQTSAHHFEVELDANGFKLFEVQ
jgi:glycosidase